MPTDLDRLQGIWRVKNLESDGAKLPAASLAGAEVVVKGQTFASSGMGAAYKGRLEVNSRTKPKSFDLVFTSGPEKGNRNLGIYKLDEDRWVICLATRGKTRPARFATKKGTGFALETLTRARATAAAPKRSPVAKPPAARPSAAPTPLEGEWAMVSAVFDGKPMAADMIAWCKRITRGDVTSVMAGPQTMLKARFTVDSTKRPGAIDYLNLEGSHKDKPQAGIFDLTGGLLRICMAAPGQPRPDVFVSRPGDGRSFTTWRLP